MTASRIEEYARRWWILVRIEYQGLSQKGLGKRRSPHYQPTPTKIIRLSASTH
ncbi:MAG: hypothetical protein F6K48_17040 [Okeania sp. SIO3H1]|nr:hypothetical protein [Okeania sp. SIO3H1]